MKVEELLLRTIDSNHQERMEFEFFKMSGELSKISQTLGDSIGLCEDSCVSILRAFDEPLEKLNNLIDIYRKHLYNFNPKKYEDCFGIDSYIEKQILKKKGK